MSFFMPVHNQAVQLQSTCSAATAGCSTNPENMVHHPITCTGNLAYDEDGSLSCDHQKMEPDDPRTQAVLNHSMALLIIELAMSL